MLAQNAALCHQPPKQKQKYSLGPRRMCAQGLSKLHPNCLTTIFPEPPNWSSKHPHVWCLFKFGYSLHELFKAKNLLGGFNMCEELWMDMKSIA